MTKRDPKCIIHKYEFDVEGQDIYLEMNGMFSLSEIEDYIKKAKNQQEDEKYICGESYYY